MSEDWIRWGIGLLVAGNAYFVADAIRRGNQARDHFLVLSEKVDALGKAMRDITHRFAELGEMRTDVALLKYKVFGRPRSNGHDKAEKADVDLDS